jgi:hypothetical protein
MRISFCRTFSCMLLVLSALGMAFAQDTNFATGPQYLMNSDPTNQASPRFARPISTPSLSLTGPPLEVGASNATEGLVAGAENRNVLRPQPDSLPTVDLFPIYYGAPPVSVIEISFPEYSSEPFSSELPASILDTGVRQITTAQALRERGYGVTLAEAAAYGKAQTRRAARLYTNADIYRLRSGS